MTKKFISSINFISLAVVLSTTQLTLSSFTLPYSGNIGEEGKVWTQGIYSFQWTNTTKKPKEAIVLRSRDYQSPWLSFWYEVMKTNGFSIRFYFTLPYSGYVFYSTGMEERQKDAGHFWNAGAYSSARGQDLIFYGDGIWPKDNYPKQNGFAVHATN